MRKIYSLLLLGVLFYGCIGEDFVDDYVDPNLRIANPILSIREGFSYRFQAMFFDESGTQIHNPQLEWSAEPADRVHIDQTGKITALNEGEVLVTVQTHGLQGKLIQIQFEFTITPKTSTAIETTPTGSTTETTSPYTATTGTTTTTATTGTTTDTGVVVASNFFEGQIRSTSSYQLQGDFRYKHNGIQIILSLNSNYKASSSLPGLYVYLTNNPSTPSGGYEIGKVTVFEGPHQYILPPSIMLRDYIYILYWCKPFTVKVGDAQLFLL